MVYEEIQRLGLDPVKDEKRINVQMRHNEGPTVLAKRVAFKVKNLIKQGKTKIVLDGLYSWPEYKYLHQQFGENLFVIAVLSDKKLRHQRLLKRVDARRSYNKKQINDRDLHEIENLEKGGPIAYADYYVLNNDSIQQLKNQLNQITEVLD